MVGFTGNPSQHLTDQKIAVAGAIAGGLTRAVVQPLDVVKIRFQLQVEPIKQMHNVKYWSVSQAFKRIYVEEGIVALWKGHVPAQFLSVVYGIVQMTCFEVFTREIWFIAPKWRGSQHTPALHFVCGAAAGLFASVVSFPLDTVRTRFVAQGKQKIYMSTIHAIQEILRKEGSRGLFKGLSPILVQIVPHSGIQFSAYTALSKLPFPTSDGHPAIHHSLSSGAIAGAIAKAAVYPLDLAKKRLQVIGFEDGRVGFGKTFSTTGLSHCIQKIIRTEGLGALYKGLWPSLIKASVSSALYFTCYENSCKFMLKYS